MIPFELLVFLPTCNGGDGTYKRYPEVPYGKACATTVVFPANEDLFYARMHANWCLAKTQQGKSG